MRISACRIEAFGPFEDRVFYELDAPVVVVQGPNEAGKTSLLRFFQTMLYGIEPSGGARHPYAREQCRPALEGRLRYHCTDGTSQVVHRRLRSVPEAYLSTDGSSDAPSDLQNHPLPVVAHVARDVFSSVYVLSGHELGALRGEVREEVEARALGLPEAPNVRPPAEAVDALEEDAARYWQSGAQSTDRAPARKQDADTSRAAHVRTHRHDLRQQLRRAEEHDRERRGLRRDIAALTARLKALGAEGDTLDAHLHRAERLRPVRDLVEQMDAHAERAGDLEPFEDVPEEPRPVLRGLREDIAQRQEDANRNEAAREKAQATQAAFTDADRRVEAEAEAIRAWAGKRETHAARAEHRRTLLEEAEQLSAVLDERALRLFDAPLDDALSRKLDALPENEVEARVQAYRRADDAVEALELRADTLARKVDRRKRLWPWALAIFAGVAALVVSLWLVRPFIGAVGAGVLVAGGLQLFNAWRYNHERDERLGELDLEIEEREEARAERSAAVAELLGDLPLPEERAAHPGYRLYEALRDLRRQRGERAAVRQQAAALAEALRADEAAVAALAGRCGVDEGEEPAPGDAPDPARFAALTGALEERLAAAQQRHHQADEADARLETLRRRRDDMLPPLKERRRRYEALTDTLRTLDDDLPAALETLAERRRAARHARHARATLFREHPDWKALQEEIRTLEEEHAGEAGALWAYTDEEVARMKTRRTAAAEEAQEAKEERADKRAQAERLAQRPAPGDVASKLAAAERQLTEAQRQRDRLLLLAGAIREADRAFRRRRQPAPVEHAGRYLRVITDARYRQLTLEGREQRLHVYRTDAPPPGGTAAPGAEAERPQAVAAPLSRGLRDQVHTALRLALPDALDETHETLPVFLDEVFATWDRERRKRGYAIVEELSARRQVFVFTCHPALADELSRRLDGVRRVQL